MRKRTKVSSAKSEHHLAIRAFFRDFVHSRSVNEAAHRYSAVFFQEPKHNVGQAYNPAGARLPSHSSERSMSRAVINLSRDASEGKTEMSRVRFLRWLLTHSVILDVLMCRCMSYRREEVQRV